MIDPIAALNDLAERVLPDAAREAAEDGGSIVLAESNAHVPLGRGRLRDSGKVTSQTTGSKATAAVSYDRPYAVDAHEDMDLEHDPGRTSKFLENAMNSKRPAVLNAAGRRIRSRTGA